MANNRLLCSSNYGSMDTMACAVMVLALIFGVVPLTVRAVSACLESRLDGVAVLLYALVLFYCIPCLFIAIDMSKLVFQTL